MGESLSGRDNSMCKGPEGRSLVGWRNNRDQCDGGERARGEQQEMSLEVTGLQIGEGHYKAWVSE